MAYLLNNASAGTALRVVTAVQRSLAETQDQLASGLAVRDSADSVAYWSIAQTMSSDAGALGAVSGALKSSAAMLASFGGALEQAISIVNLIKNDVIEAYDPGVDTIKLQTEIRVQKTKLLQLANSADYNGQNWLNGSVRGSTANFQATANLVGGYDHDGGVAYISIAASAICLFANGPTATIGTATGGILSTRNALCNDPVLGPGSINVVSGNPAFLAGVLRSINYMIGKLEEASGLIGGAQAQIATQMSFVQSMRANLSNGVASLIDADMETVGARQRALETQQNLGLHSLSIANQSQRAILQLFQ